MVSRLRKLENPDREGVKRNLTVWRERGRCCGELNGREGHGAVSALQEDVGQYMSKRMESLGSDSSVRVGFVQLSRESAVPLQMQSTNST